MKTFYHGTNKNGWDLIKKQGFLLCPYEDFDFPGHSINACFYLTPFLDEAKCHGEHILEVKYDPIGNPRKNNYTSNCWQFRVYEPIPSSQIKLIYCPFFYHGTDSRGATFLKEKNTYQFVFNKFVKTRCALDDLLYMFYIIRLSGSIEKARKYGNYIFQIELDVDKGKDKRYEISYWTHDKKIWHGDSIPSSDQIKLIEKPSLFKY